MLIHFTCGKNDTLRQNRRNCAPLFLVLAILYYYFLSHISGYISEEYNAAEIR
jgi:hypothetical protein